MWLTKNERRLMKTDNIFKHLSIERTPEAVLRFIADDECVNTIAGNCLHPNKNGTNANCRKCFEQLAKELLPDEEELASATEERDAAKAALAKMTQKMQFIQNTAYWLTQYCLKDGGGHKRSLLLVEVYTHLSNILQVSSTLDASDALEEWRAMEKMCEALSKFIEWREPRGVLLLAVVSASKGLDALRKAKGEVKP